MASDRSITQRSFVPVGPAIPLHQVYNQLPWVVQPIATLNRNTRCGRGMICPVTTTAANTPVTIRHNLGRLVFYMIPLGTGSLGYPARIALASGPRTNAEQAVQTDVAVTMLVWFL